MNNFFKKNWSIFLLVFFVFFGFYLRVGGVISNSFAFTYDVGRDMLEVQKIVQDLDIPLIGQTTGLGGLYYGPWWYYFLTPSFFLSGGDPQMVAFFMVMIGMSTVILGYYFGQITSGRGFALLLASFLSFSKVMVGYSIQIWNPNIAPFFLVLLLICIFKEPRKHKINIIRNILIGFILGLLLDAEIVFGVLLIAGVSLSYMIVQRRKFFSVDKLLMLFGFLITLFPRVVFEFRHNFIMTKSLFMEKSEEQQIFNFFDFFNVLPDRIYVFLVQIGDTFGLSFYYSLFFSLLIVFILILCRKKIKKIEKKILLFSAIILAVFLFGSSLFARAVWGHYIVGLPVIYIAIVSISLLALIRSYRVTGIILTILLVFICVRPPEVVKALQNPNWEGNAAVYKNQTAVIDYVYKKANGRNFNYIVYTPAVHDYPYQYLFSWYGKNKYNYMPAKNTEHLLYVIIEPDPGFEGRIKDWLKIREGDGVVEKEEQVRGGIIVQTRIR